MTKWLWLFLAAAMLVVPARICTGQEKTGQEKDAQASRARVVLDLVTRKQNFAVGEKWSVFATISNKFDGPIWITSETSLLVIPTEILGESRRFFSQFAFLPTLGDRVSDQVIRINPGEIGRAHV